MVVLLLQPLVVQYSARIRRLSAVLIKASVPPRRSGLRPRQLLASSRHLGKVLSAVLRLEAAEVLRGRSVAEGNQLVKPALESVLSRSHLGDSAGHRCLGRLHQVDSGRLQHSEGLRRLERLPALAVLLNRSGLVPQQVGGGGWRARLARYSFCFVSDAFGATAQSSSFGNLANQSTLGFGNLAQQSQTPSSEPNAFSRQV